MRTGSKSNGILYESEFLSDIDESEKYHKQFNYAPPECPRCGEGFVKTRRHSRNIK